VLAQVKGSLDRRLAAGFAAMSPGPALLAGMDTPQVTIDHLAFEPDRHDACLGPATDGGYWAVGLADPACAAALIEGVPMSGPDIGAIQYRRLCEAGLAVQLLALVAMTGKVEWLPVVFASGIAAFGSSHFGDPTGYRAACYAVALGLLLLGITARRRLARRRVRLAAGGEGAERDRTTRPRLDVRSRLPLIG
jgi:hypothetical protein